MPTLGYVERMHHHTKRCLTSVSICCGQVAHATAVAEEAVGNVRTVRAFAMEDSETECYGREVDRSRDLHIRLGIGIGCFQVRHSRADRPGATPFFYFDELGL